MQGPRKARRLAHPQAPRAATRQDSVRELGSRGQKAVRRTRAVAPVAGLGLHMRLFDGSGAYHVYLGMAVAGPIAKPKDIAAGYMTSLSQLKILTQSS